MRPRCIRIAVSIVLLAANCPMSVAERYAVLPREGSTSTSSSSATASPGSSVANGLTSSAGPSTTPSPLGSSSQSTSTAVASSSASEKPAVSTALPTSSDIVLGASSTPIANGSLGVNDPTPAKIVGLPIQPQITPALSVAGAFLILSGIFYTLIGIKTKWLHIYLSAAYLFSLGVILLIVYVIHPPVTKTVQGAYFVAACLTGLVAGGASVWFADITEGLGCLLGGFCLSMWCLTLKAGGLIDSTAGKAIFISCFTAAAFASYISHYTRPYGLIGSISFAGATVIVIGIDCFSRAGLKEFWLYIWNLNGDLFPLHYSGPYPITRGIRVEIACIVLICVLGVMSQMKVWQVVKRKREQRAAEQTRKKRERDLADEEQGRKVEEGNEHDRPMWEAVYGGQDRLKVQHTDSGIGTDEPGSTRKGSVNNEVREIDAEGMEMQNMNGNRLQNDTAKGGAVTIHVAREDEIHELPLVPGVSSTDLNPTTSKEPQAASSNPPSPETVAAKSQTSVIDPTLTLQPKVVHLPFKVPDQDSQSDGEGSSVATFADSDRFQPMHSNRLSGSSIMRKLSKKSRKASVDATRSEEALMIPHLDDDQGSSVAATVDGVSEQADSDEEAPSLKSQSPGLVNSKDASAEALIADASCNGGDAADPEHHVETEAKPSANQETEAINPASIPSSPPEVMPVETERPESVGVQSAEEQKETTTPPPAASTVTSQATAQRLTRKSLSENLPEGASKVVMAYRTNEWAKHLDGAELPEIDELKDNNTNAAISKEQEERAVPVNVRSLQQTPLTAEPTPRITNVALASSNRSPRSPKSPSSRVKPKNTQDKQQDVPQLRQLTLKNSAERTPSQTSLIESVSRTSSQTSLNSPNGKIDISRGPVPKRRSSQPSVNTSLGYRSSSQPLATSPLVESPIEEGIESSYPTRFTPSTTHLMSQRDSMLRNKPSSTSLLRTSWTNATVDQHPAFRSLEGNDEITLSQRRSLLQQNPQIAPQPHRTTSGGSKPIRPLSHQTLSRSSLTPQPLRPKPSKREFAESAWRASLQPSTSAHLQAQEMADRQADLLAQKRRESTSQLQQQYAQGRRESVLDMGMRRGSMMELHKEAMRKMQGQANKNLNPSSS